MISLLPTDIRILESSVELAELRFRHPLTLSSGAITETTYASVTVTVADRRGHVAQGRGGVVLSDLWAIPSLAVSHLAKSAFMRGLVTEIDRSLSSADGYHDPFEIARVFHDELAGLARTVWGRQASPESVPDLAAMVCWSPFDAAVHDAWGRAAGQSAYRMYTGEYLNADLSSYLGPEWTDLYPGSFLGRGRSRLGVQHVVGLSDRLTPAGGDVAEESPAARPASLAGWIERDGVRSFKLKVTGRDVERDLSRILDVYGVAASCLARTAPNAEVRLCIDANEACPSPEPVIELLRKLRERSAAAYDALTYVEQPTPRRLADYAYTLHDLAEYKPVVVDESLDSLANLPLIESQGWSGVAVKTCKGQSHSLVAYCWAKRKGMFITVQDLTNPGLALVQSANLANHLSRSEDAFEYNSRQYLEDFRLSEARDYGRLFDVSEGDISLAEIRHEGVY